MDYFLRAFGNALDLIVGLDPEVYRIVWTSVRISLSAVLLASVMAVPAGILTAIFSFPGKRLLQQILDTLMALPTVVVGLVFFGLLTRRGPLGGLGLLYTPAAVVIGECVLIIPLIWNLAISAAAGADRRVRAASRALGAAAVQEAVIFLGEVRYALMAAVIAGFGRAIGEVGVAMMLGGNIAGYTRTMTTAIALQTSKGEFEFGLALGMLLLGTAFLVTVGLQYFRRISR